MYFLIIKNGNKMIDKLFDIFLLVKEGKEFYS